MVGAEEGREFRFRGDLYSQESTFLLFFFYFSLFVSSFMLHLLRIKLYITPMNSSQSFQLKINFKQKLILLPDVRCSSESLIF